LNINALIEEMMHMLQVSISKKAVLRTDLKTTVPAIEGDSTQLRQIIMNLVINASEAIGDRSGTITIHTDVVKCDTVYLNNFILDDKLAEGEYVFFEVADSGCGMDRETMGKIFDPFFTTKFTGRGLGMAAVLGIVRGHKGAIRVYSEVGKGTAFKILLPASRAGSASAEDGTVEQPERMGGTILLVDDDGRHALEVFGTGKDIDVVILDLTMPHIDGEQCFRELKRIKPEVKVVLSSGYNHQEVTQKFVGKGLAGFVQKPYRLNSLRDILHSILHA
jgi:CheY-like chemotaxis protein